LRPNSLPGLWATLVPALILGVASGCSAGGGKGDLGLDTTARESSDRNSAPATSSGAGSNAVAPGGATPAATPPTATTPNEPSSPDPVAPVPTEQQPIPNLTPPVDPPAPNAGNDPPRVEDDEDDDDDDDDDRDRDDDDDDDDDDGDDDDRDDDDDDDDDQNNAAPVNPANPGTPAELVTFTTDIRDILLDNCGRCHSSGRLPNFAAADPASSYDVAVRERDEIVELIAAGEMPADTCRGAPGTNGCVSVANFNLIRQWVAAGVPE